MKESGWHFVDNNALRDGSLIPADGEWLEYGGRIRMCQSGLHYSRRLIDALTYAPGHTVCRVEIDALHEYVDDKGVARRRKILWRVDGKSLLRDFARRCALDVVRLWDAPDVVIRFLKTGDKSLRDAAWAAAWAAARAAARNTARNAAWAAAWAATSHAARDVAWDAARNTAWDAARDTARAAQNRRLTSMVMAAHRGR